MNVYAITAVYGTFEDRTETTCGIFSDKETAVKEARSIAEEYNIDELKLPMTFQKYADLNYGLPDELLDRPENEDSMTYEELADYYNTPIDKYSYTVEQFRIMESARIKKDEYFICVYLREYELDTPGMIDETVFYSNGTTRRYNYV